MKEIIRKLTSRKFWGFLIGVALGLGLALGVPEEQIGEVSATVQKIAGYIGAILSCAVYIMGESGIDAARVQSEGIKQPWTEMMKKLLEMSQYIPSCECEVINTEKTASTENQNEPLPEIEDEK